MKRLIETRRAPAGKWRVLCDNYGRWATHHEEWYTDCDTLEEARAAAALTSNAPKWYHFTVSIFNAEGKLTQ